MMTNVNVAFDRSLLRDARVRAKDSGVKLGRLTTYRCKALGANTYYEVYEDTRLVWDGAAATAYEAKAKYILSRLS